MNVATHPTPRLTAALDRRGVFALAMSVFLLFLIVISAGWQAERNVAALERVKATFADGMLLQSLLLAIEDCESGQRGYLLTGKPDYLAPFLNGKSVLPHLLAELDRRFPSEAAEPALRQTIDAKLAELTQTVELAQAGNRDAALAIVATDAGRSEMVRIRDMTGRLFDQQQAEMAQRVAEIESGGRLLIAIDAASLVIVMGLAAIIGVGLRRYLADLEQARMAAAQAYDELTRNNERLDEAVRARTADLTLANEEIQRFAYIVSHDLRSPLVNIMGFTGELEQAAQALTSVAQTAEWPAPARDAISEDIPEALRFIKTSTSKMDRLINAILTLSREGRRTLAKEHLEMETIVEDLVASMRHQAKINDVEITVGPMPQLQSDRIAIEQIFGNVVDNALKYLKPGRPGRIAITAEETGSDIRFRIADNGRGIAARDFERIFELFRRAGDQSVPGEGIGLAHVRALVRRLGGSIECESDLNVGTTFIITLPRDGSQRRGSFA